jgi:hypothetical protein
VEEKGIPEATGDGCRERERERGGGGGVGEKKKFKCSIVTVRPILPLCLRREERFCVNRRGEIGGLPE